ncbi:phage tail family protein [Acutalibacter muris]|uniref:Phage tail family protein n=1 Tax=Acutalibacter muris TaxID=1796620 RepID=A0A1Z2XPV2_9FIRM|nr:distal tail protein Dit [Acutalibacter muris]ANU52894.1 phage tail protein [Hungateiclostridiaceae bacterium KB18]ASB40434.1 phage tail protein [Acutalibacter muris]QQR29725.1 phage tail family protein [Acutalibacter muris]
MKIKARLTSWQASPALRNFYETVPGKAGVADFGCDSGERIIMLTCYIYPQKDFAALVSVLNAMAQWLDPSKGLKQLVLDEVPDRYFMARLSEAVDCERLLRSAGTFTLKFICPDPHAYALEDETFVISEEGEHEISRSIGTTISEPVYSIQGVISSDTDSYISIIINGEELRITGALAEGETLIVDSNLVTAKVVDSVGDTLRNGLPLLYELNFPVLETSTNTVVVATSNATFTELNIEANSRWR